MISVSRLRMWFAAVAILMVVTVVGFYAYARYRVHKALRELPKAIGVEIQQSTENFSLSKSEGGRTLFTVKASKAIQYKQGGRASLKDVNIVVYGRNSNRFDQIYGSDFEYDQQTGIVRANGDVHIDLQGNDEGKPRPDQGPPKELKNPIHLKTSGLVMNTKTGIAHTDDPVEFRIPQVEGSAKGATYDSKANELTLESQVQLVTTDDRPTTVRAAHGVITKDPQRITLSTVDITQAETKVEAAKTEIFVRDDNTIDHITATGNVRMNRGGDEPLAVAAPRVDIYTAEKNTIRSAVLSGGVTFNSTGQQPANGSAGRVTLDFGADDKLRTVRATDDVVFRQPASEKSPQALELVTNAVVANASNGKKISSAQTAGAAKMTIVPAKAAAGEQTVVSADKFVANFGARGRLAEVRGEGNARIVSSGPNQPERTSTSRTLVAQFAPGGGLTAITQAGDFKYSEPASKDSAERKATAETARYTPDDQIFTLSGAPRLVDGGMSVTAQSVRIDRRRGDAFAQGDLKTTYSDLRPEPNGAMLAKSDPVHVTSKNMNVQRQSGIARYTGGARLWQGANIVQAATIEFDQQRRTVVADGTTNQPVSCVFVQAEKSGKTTPVVVTAPKLTYNDAERRARYLGGVVVKGADLSLTADHVDIILHPASQTSAQSGGQQRASVAPSQLQQIVAQNRVAIQQPNRRAVGDKLVYTAADGKFVLSGGPPMVVDAEHGNLKGDSLTFYSRDDRVVVESAGSSRTVTHTRINQ